MAFKTDVVAHELGHNWNAVHCACSDPPSTMNPTITQANYFSTDSVSRELLEHSGQLLLALTLPLI